MAEKANPYRKNSKKAEENRVKRDAQAAGTPATVPEPQEPAKGGTTAPLETVNKGGRPRTADNRIAFTLKVKKDVRKVLKQAALDHDCTASDIVDALVEQCMGQLDWNVVGQ